MKIHDNRKNKERVPFSELLIGDTFEYNDGLFIKIPHIYDEDYGENNCFDLYNNCLCYCYNDDTVEILECKLIIN